MQFWNSSEFHLAVINMLRALIKKKQTTYKRNNMRRSIEILMKNKYQKSETL